MAVTRAKALLIVVGNPRVLNTDPTWARYVSHLNQIFNSREQPLLTIVLFSPSLRVCRFIQYCRDEGGYTGFSPAEEDEDVVVRLAALYISIEATGDRTICLFSLARPSK